MNRRISMIVCLVACLAALGVLAASLRSWSVHSWLSVASHGHLFFRIVHTSELDEPIPKHYPIHTLESQCLVFSGKTYLGYASKHGFFVPDGTDWESAAVREGSLLAFIFLGTCVSILVAIGLVIAIFGDIIRKRKSERARQVFCRN